jgi:hypothetical protein
MPRSLGSTLSERSSALSRSTGSSPLNGAVPTIRRANGLKVPRDDLRASLGCTQLEPPALHSARGATLGRVTAVATFRASASSRTAVSRIALSALNADRMVMIALPFPGATTGLPSVRGPEPRSHPTRVCGLRRPQDRLDISCWREESPGAGSGTTPSYERGCSHQARPSTSTSPCKTTCGFGRQADRSLPSHVPKDSGAAWRSADSTSIG